MRTRELIVLGAAALVLAAAYLLLQPAQRAAPEERVTTTYEVWSPLDDRIVDLAIKASWTKAAPDWQARLVQDETQRLCSQHRNAPPNEVANAMVAREKAAIKYPADGNLMGDWRKGEKLAQSGYGWRFTDYPPRQANGGNCYACHQLDKKELSFGTLGPSLSEYGKARRHAEADVKAVYERIYNPQAAVPCASMPRFGTSGFLSIDQIRDVVAYVMSPDSPVNK